MTIFRKRKKYIFGLWLTSVDMALNFLKSQQLMMIPYRIWWSSLLTISSYNMRSNNHGREKWTTNWNHSATAAANKINKIKTRHSCIHDPYITACDSNVEIERKMNKRRRKKRISHRKKKDWKENKNSICYHALHIVLPYMELNCVRQTHRKRIR